MVLQVAPIARPRRWPKLGHLLSEPAIRRLTELQPRVRRLALTATRLDPRIVASQTRRGQRLERTAPPLATVGIAEADLEGSDAAESLRQAALDRRYGKRTMSFNCFDVIIDADTAIVTLEDAIDLDGQRAVLSLNDLVRDLSS
jgi:hypothetical protein